ncbi:hypothetical protein [Vallitalea okinawensis]|uniref:hypothetical protein n=1 Tax=Vallitalea okinawensis TaxID=2078660 RepID=UPI000CFDBAD9|nr:hypothetical protein [Vallitalea okinawensis]
MKVDYSTHLLLREPISIKEVGEVHQPLVKEILHIGEEKLDEYIKVLSLSKEHIGNMNEVELRRMTNFDLVFLITDQYFRSTIIEALEFFTQQKVCFLKEVHFISVGKQGRLNGENYDEFVDIVLEMLCRGRAQPDHQRTKKMSGKQRSIYNKIMKYRRLKQKKDKFQLVDIINIVKHGGPNFLTREQIKKMTYYELMKCFEMIISKDNYDEYLRYKTSPNYKVEESVQHWTISIKNNK